MMMSADRVIFASSRLCECTTVTVAFPFLFFCMSSRASGFPTIMLRPRTTTCAPLISMSLSRSNRCTPSGVHGTNRWDPQARALRHLPGETHPHLCGDRARARSLLRRCARAAVTEPECRECRDHDLVLRHDRAVLPGLLKPAAPASLSAIPTHGTSCLSNAHTRAKLDCLRPK